MLGILKSRQDYNIVEDKDKDKSKSKRCPCGVTSHVMATYGGNGMKTRSVLTPALDVDG